MPLNKETKPSFFEVLFWSPSGMVLVILRRGQPRYLSLWWDFCYIVWFREVFSFSCGILFFFSFISTCLMVSASSISKYLLVAFSPSVLIFSWFVNSLPSIICRFPLSLFAWRISLSEIPSLYIDYICSLY